ncbi:putative ribonuclease H-like domain-containing protein [Tanacetum coccineum]
MSFDDLYNNFKIVEQEVKRTASSSSSLCSQNMAFVSSPSSTNEVNTAYGVSIANTQVSPASTQVSTAISIAEHKDKKFFQKTGRNITINESDTAGYDKSKVECFNCHKMGHFARECRGPRNQDSRNMNQDSSRRTVNVEETSSKAMVAIDGVGFDWSYMADDEVLINIALMDFSDSEFNKSEFNLATYKRGLASIEEQLVFYKKNKLEKLKQEKESNHLKIENFDNASKSLDKLIRSQITDKSRKGMGFVSYNVVPPPHTGLFSSLNLDLSYFGLEEFQQPKFEGYGPKTSKNVSEDIFNKVKETLDAPLVEELVSDDKLEKKTVFSTVSKIEFVRPKQQEKLVRKPKLGSDFVMYNKACFVCGSFDHVQIDCNYHQRERVVSGNNYTRGRPQKEDQGYVDSGCSRHMTGSISYLSYFKEFDRGYVTFGGGGKGGKITGKRTLKTGKLDLKDVYFVKELYVDVKNIVPKKSLTCLVAKATLDESMLWHRRLGHVNFKTINKLVKENLVRGLHIKRFENDQTCVACLKGKQHKASCKSKIQNSITQPLFMLHMDLFGPTFVSSLMNKKYCLVVTDDYSRFTWVFFLATKDETSGILKSFIIKAEAVNTTCYVQNRVLVVKPYNKTPYELFRGRTPALSSMRPFWCHVTILNTLDYLGKFDEKSDGGFFIRYSMKSDGPKWMFDIDVLIKSINYVPFVAGTNSNDFVGTEESIGACHSNKETKSSQDYILMPLWKDGSLFDSSLKNASNDEPQPSSDVGKKNDEGVYMFSLGDNATLKATHADLFGDETEVDISNITTTYPVPSTPITRIHKDHSLDHVIGDVQSGVQTRRMIKTTNEQGFISAVYEGKTHEDLHTCLFACFLSQVEPKKVIQALTDPSWIEAMRDELL